MPDWLGGKPDMFSLTGVYSLFLFMAFYLSMFFTGHQYSSRVLG
jgi:hypothetical protein